MRSAACRERGLSHGAARLFCVLVDVFYLEAHDPAEFEFEAAWSTITKWIACGRNQARTYRDELVKLRFIRFRRLKGIPPTCSFSFSKEARFGAFEGTETGPIKAPKRGLQEARNGPPLTKSTLKGKRFKTEGGGRDAVKPPAPPPPPERKKTAGPWWASPPQFEELDRKTFARERKALGKESLEWLTAELERLQVEFHGQSAKEWPLAAQNTRDAILERRRAVKGWMHGMSR